MIRLDAGVQTGARGAHQPRGAQLVDGVRVGGGVQPGGGGGERVGQRSAGDGERLQEPLRAAVDSRRARGSLHADR